MRYDKPKFVQPANVSTDKLDEDKKELRLKDAEDSDRPRPTSTRSVLTLKPLLKIDPKDKGKKVLEEEAESEAESEGVNKAKRKFAHLDNDEEIARKARLKMIAFYLSRLQEEEREKFTIEREPRYFMILVAAQIRSFLAQQRVLNSEENHLQRTHEKENDDMRLCLTIAPYEDKEYDESKDLEEINLNVVITSSGQRRYISTLMKVLSIFDRDDLNVVYQLLYGTDTRCDTEVLTAYFGETYMIRVHTLMTDEGLVIHMLVEKQYPLRKKVLVQMLELKLESEEDNTMELS
ncbi:hypothetical protein Tco_0428993 [Tanacetum coccineum]